MKFAVFKEEIDRRIAIVPSSVPKFKDLGLEVIIETGAGEEALYSDEEYKAVIKECKLNAEHHEDIEAETAKLLAEGHIVGWYQGAMEIGPRALGNRSILADPSKPDRSLRNLGE